MIRFVPCSRLLGAAMLLLSIASCDLLQPPVDDDTPTRPRRDGGEGEGEGEGEGPNVPPDVSPHPQGPRVQSFSASQTTLNDNQTATLTAVVSDPDGAADIIGALLIEPVSGSTLGTLSTAGAPGTFTASISWSDYGAVAPIEFVRGSAQRFIRVQFSDGQGHQTTSTLALTMACGDDLPACNNSCGEVRCAGQDNQCLSTQGNAISNDDLCSVCNTGCQACGADCACFDPSSRCSGGSDCVALVDADSNVTATECRVTGGPAVRNDGFVTWSVGGRALPVAFGQRFSLPVNATEIVDLLCAPFGGFRDFFTEALPTDLATGEIVLTLEDGCSAASLQTLAQCEPVIGLSTAVVNGQGQRITCVDPIGSTPGTGAFQETCASGGACTGDMACDGDNVCQESCFDTTDCDSCVAANPAGCSCDPTGACQVGGGGGGGANNPVGDGQIRLVNGSARSGRVEISFSGTFGTVCDDTFNDAAAQVVCRQLGFSGGSPVVNSTFGSGTGPIQLDEFTCSGTEGRLDECSNIRVGVNDCTHSEDVGVSCQ